MCIESPQSDAELLEAVREGNAAAYGRLHERHATAARALARQLVRGEEEIEDVVAEAFTKILDLVGRGGGPGDAFRTYLLTVVRRTVHDRARIESRQVSTGDTERFDPGVPFVDPALVGLEKSMIAQAFLSLPERWRAVLWHTEVEGAKPAEVAPLLGLSPNGVPELSYRAREGLRQAYIQMHLSASSGSACEPVLFRMGAHVRGALSRRDSRTVTGHVNGCARCHAVMTELTDIHGGLRAVIGPLLLGPVFPGYASALSRPAPAPPSSALVRVIPTPRGSPAPVGPDTAAVEAPFGTPVAAERAEEETAFWEEDAGLADADEDLGLWEDLGDRKGGDRVGRDREGEDRAGRDRDGEDRAGRDRDGEDRVHDRTGEGSPEDGRSGGDGRSVEEREAGACGARRTPCLLAWLQRVAASRRVAVAGGAAVAVVAATTFAVASGRHAVDRLPTSPMAHPLTPGRSPLTVTEPNPVSPPGPESGWAAGGDARLRVTIDPLGALVRARPGIIAIRVRNSGGGPSAEVKALVDLPPGVAMMPPGSRGHGAVLGPATSPPRRSPRTPPRRVLPSQEASPPRDTSPGPAGPPGGDVLPGRDLLPGLGVLPGRDATPGRDTTPGSDAAPGGAAKRHRRHAAAPPGAREAVGSVGTGSAVGGWVCRPVPEGARCVRGALRAGESTVLFLRVQVAPDAREGAAPAVRVRAGRQRTAARAAAGVRLSGAPARFATEGKVSVMAVGNSLLTCPGGQAGCPEARRREGTRRDNDLWSMVPLDADRTASTAASSAARLRMPRRGRVVWAGLYWSAGGGVPGPIRLRPPGHRRYEPVRPDQVVAGRLPSGAVYQAFADVTGLVANSRKDGDWWAADAPMEPGVSRHAGWSLVVISTGPAKPYTRTVVLDGAAVTGDGHGSLRLPLDGLTPGHGPARVRLVTWEGDAELGGDTVSAGGGPLVPEGGDRDAANPFDGSSGGATGTTFGVDVDTFEAELGDDPALTITSEKDAILFGIAAVTTRTRQ
ncbi:MULTISPECIES: sigma-70 family RNA polymerase sigma factor [unclassified Nonomuraea]|uniref:sigma-70 family RNA polymerase sigma factor n=1 Tax=unclassified Nonomuraea TaxID=2593643 RepID=UPI0033E6C1B0